MKYTLLKNTPLQKLMSKLRQLTLRESISGLQNSLTPFLPIAIFDLQQAQIPPIGSRIELRSFAFGESGESNNPSIASIALENNVGHHYTHHFIGDMRGSLKQQSDKPTAVIDEPALLLPYYTTHFGHFTGDCLGAIIALSKFSPTENRKLFFIAPNQFDTVINQYGNEMRLHKINSQQASTHNLIFSDACLLPRISPWQNLSLCGQIFGEAVSSLSTKPQKVFLTSERAGRIENIAEVLDFLRTQNVYILNPHNHGFEETLAILRDADVVISENGSITHNILIARNKPFYVLSAPGWNQLSPSEFAGGGIYNAFKDYLSNYIECQPSQKESHHPFSTLITVDLADLKAIL
jgi:capsular polysaccharide biosynthesis protein